jgi:hypothetical protein
MSFVKRKKRPELYRDESVHPTPEIKAKLAKQKADAAKKKKAAK